MMCTLLSSIYLLSSICGVYYVYLQLVVVHVVAGGSDQAVTSAVGSLSPVAGPRVTLVTLVPPRDT